MVDGRKSCYKCVQDDTDNVAGHCCNRDDGTVRGLRTGILTKKQAGVDMVAGREGK